MKESILFQKTLSLLKKEKSEILKMPSYELGVRRMGTLEFIIYRDKEVTKSIGAYDYATGEYLFLKDNDVLEVLKNCHLSLVCNGFNFN